MSSKQNRNLSTEKMPEKDYFVIFIAAVKNASEA